MASGGKAISKKWVPSKEAPAYLHTAIKDIGIQEWVLDGKVKKPNPVVVGYIEQVCGKRLNSMTTPWCAYWIGAKLQDEGWPSTKSGMARSYLKWGTEVNHKDANAWREGDVVIFWRGRVDDGVTGHVAILLDWDARTVTCLGANQGDKVSVQVFDRRKIIGLRRPRPLTASRTVRATGGAAVSETVKTVLEHTMPDPDKVMATVDKTRPSIEQLATYKPWLLGVLSVVTLVCIAYGIYYRYYDYKEGKNA